VTLGGAHALAAIDRPALRRFLLEMCVPPAAGGGMRMHAGGEVDVRGCYCALAAARMVSLDTGEIADACALGAFVARCQSHEGGLGGEPGNEAHGGYAFCGLAALALAERAGAVDARAALRWASRMQGSFEGGFMGRTAKLVDGCYSLWQGGAFALLARALAGEGGGAAVRPRVPADAELEAHAERVAAGLLGAEGDAEAAFVEALRPEAPEAAAVRLLAAAEGRLEAAVAAALAADEAAAAAAGAPEAGARRAAALAALEAAAEARAAVERAAAHERAARCAAPVLLREYRPGGADAAEEGPSASGGASAPLYDAAAQQLWVLAACQAPRGGLRDKPGKPPDYYHSCYCLSGLAAAQRDAGGAPLGGRANALAEPDPLCNVVAARLAEARAFFAAADE
jgi:protein farnesyltransferase subunit beta